MAKKTKPLASWNDGPSKSAIIDFVTEVTTEGSAAYLPQEERVAVFDNDGTLWCEKPLPIALGFVLERLASMAIDDPSLRHVQPWKAAYELDYAWIEDVLTRQHRNGHGLDVGHISLDHRDDSGVKSLLSGILKAFGGTTVEEYESSACAFLQQAQHPSLERPLRGCVYRPMVELFRYLEANGFATFIASSGDRDFIRSIAWEAFRIPPERLIGSSCQLGYREDPHGGEVAYLARPEVFDVGPEKPKEIWRHVGRRPIVAVGNSNTDIHMLQSAGMRARPAMRLLLCHDDDNREFAYTRGAERALELANEMDWTVVSIKRDWRTIFGKGAA
jgi:phosphoglycolate phosphatase-like HAD superfamily hydrolase